MIDFASIAFKLRVVLLIIAALAIGAVLIALTGSNPLDAYEALFHEAFYDYWGVSNTLTKTSPILLASLAVIVPLRAGLYNIGGEGQIYIGGLSSTLVAIHIQWLPHFLSIPIAIIAAMVGGAVWASIAGILRTYRGINEVIVTLLLNYIAIFIVSYAVSGPMMAEGAPYPYSDEISKQFRLPIMLPQTDAHIGVLFGITAALMLWFYFSRTVHGLALDIIGRSPSAARYAGINLERHAVGAMAAGGALAGLAGGIEVLGLKYRLFHLFSPGYGFDGIVAAFMANANPLITPVASFFLSGLKSGAGVMQRAAGVDGTVVDVIVGIVIIFVAVGLSWRIDGLKTIFALLRPSAQTTIPSREKVE